MKKEVIIHHTNKKQTIIKLDDIEAITMNDGTAVWTMYEKD